MKTVISLPDDLMAASDVLATRLGLSRSALFAAALTEFLANHRTSNISERLDAVHSAEESRVDPATAGAQRAILRRSAW